MKLILEKWQKFLNENTNPLDNWVHEDAKSYAEYLTEEYGDPNVLTDSMALWEGGISDFDKVYVKDESIPHCCPKPHKDYVYSTMKINVPQELMEAVAKASESIIVDQLKNEVTARCADIVANAITLGFVQKLVAGEIKPEDAKEEYERHILEGITPDWFKENLEENNEEHAKTSSELLEEYPFLADDIENVQEWYPAKELRFIESTIEIEKIEKSIKEMLSTYEEFPKDKKRTDKIIKVIKQGFEIRPIFIEKNDPHNFVLEGRHRMVANYLLGYKTMPVIYVEVQNEIAIGPREANK